MMRLFIAEQPSVATDLVKILGGDFRCYDDYFESATDIVSCCINHPEKNNTCKLPNPASKAGEFDNVPLPSPRLFQEKESALALLLERADISVIVHCATYNHDGQQGVDTLLNCAGNAAPVKRVLINDSSSPAVKKTFDML